MDVRSGDCIACVCRACKWFIGLDLVEEDEAALTAADAGVTVIATEVLTGGVDIFGLVCSFVVAEDLIGVGTPFRPESNGCDALVEALIA